MSNCESVGGSTCVKMPIVASISNRRKSTNDFSGTPNLQTSPSGLSTKLEGGKLIHDSSSQFVNAFFGKGIDNRPFVDKPSFDAGIGIVICLNAIVMGIEADYKKDHEDHVVWIISENIFCVVWVFEMLARQYFHRCKYFKSGWNLMDFFLVCQSIMDAWLMPILGSSDEGVSQLGTLRLLRMLRMIRLLRLLRLMRLVKELWLIVSGFAESLKTLSWVLMLLTIIFYVGAILLAMTVGGAECEEGGAFEHWENCKMMFGNIPRGMYTLFQVVTLESWSMAVVRPVTEVQPGLLIFFVLFLFLTTFGLLNVIIGVVVETVLCAAKNNEYIQAQRMEEKLKSEIRVLYHIFLQADKDNSGELDLEEFETCLKNPAVVDFLRKLELPTNDAKVVFELFDDDESGKLTIDEFLQGVMKLRGAPSAMDMKRMTFEVKSMQNNIETVGGLAAELSKDLDALAEKRRNRHVSRQPPPPTLPTLFNPSEIISPNVVTLHESKNDANCLSKQLREAIRPTVATPTSIPKGSSEPLKNPQVGPILAEVAKVIAESNHVQDVLRRLDG